MMVAVLCAVCLRIALSEEDWGLEGHKIRPLHFEPKDVDISVIEVFKDVKMNSSALTQFQ